MFQVLFYFNQTDREKSVFYVLPLYIWHLYKLPQMAQLESK